MEEKPSIDDITRHMIGTSLSSFIEKMRILRKKSVTM